MTIGERIKSLREQNDMTLEELGNKVGVGKSTVRKWENGMIANMKGDKIASLASALNVTPAYLMGWEDKEKPLKPLENAELMTSLIADKELMAAIKKYYGLSEEKRRHIINSINMLYGEK